MSEPIQYRGYVIHLEYDAGQWSISILDSDGEEVWCDVYYLRRAIALADARAVVDMKVEEGEKERGKATA